MRIQMFNVDKHLATLVTFASLVPLVYYVPLFIQPYLPDNRLINVVVALIIIVPLVSYISVPVLMAALQRLLRRSGPYNQKRP
jgi:antibiotic biosynthesis monooxygenase (ABM) superfamily enzyme